MKYHFKVYKENVGFSAQGIELEGCITQGDTYEELQHNMQDALNLYLDEPADSTDLIPLPDATIQAADTIVEVPVDPDIALALLVRTNRINLGLTQLEAAKKMGFDSVYSYQRLETAKCNPTLKILAKIKQLFPDFSVDYILNV